MPADLELSICLLPYWFSIVLANKTLSGYMTLIINISQVNIGDVFEWNYHVKIFIEQRGLLILYRSIGKFILDMIYLYIFIMVR